MRRPLRPPRGARLITVDGVTDTIAGWALRLGVRRQTIVQRLHLGWSERDAVTTPAGAPYRHHRDP